MFIKMRTNTRQAMGTLVEPEGARAAAGGCLSRGMRRTVVLGLRSDLRLSGVHTVENNRGDCDRDLDRRPSTNSSESALSLRFQNRDAIDRRRRRYEQLQFAEERLRPLIKTKLAEVYWRVYAELHRVGREIVDESGLDAGGSRLDRE